MPPAPAVPTNPAPTTDYGTAYAEEGAFYQPQLTDVANEQSELQTQTQQSQASLDQAKANAFTNNALTSNARGIMYSGYTPAQNATYTTNTYNPAVQKLQTSAANSATTLQEKIDQINQERANDAQTLVANTQSAQASAEATALKAQVSASKSSVTSAKAAQPSSNQIANAIRTNLSKATGSDGFVSPEDYAQAYIDWLNNGQSASSFNSNFGSFKNPTNGYYTYAITNALKRS